MFTVISSFKNESENCHNFLKIIKNCLDKIEIREMVLVDNGSTDDTFDVLSKFVIENVNIKVIKNQLDSDYGQGFSSALKHVSNDYIITLHSDNQFRLDSFLEKNLFEVKDLLFKNINIFPKRINRNLFSNLRTFIVRLFLSFISFSFFPDYGGHPKFLIKKHFMNINYLPKGFSFDACLILYLKKKSFSYSIKFTTEERNRDFGISTWNKKYLKQLGLLYQFIYEFLVFFYNINNK